MGLRHGRNIRGRDGDEHLGGIDVGTNTKATDGSAIRKKALFLADAAPGDAVVDEGTVREQRLEGIEGDEAEGAAGVVVRGAIGLRGEPAEACGVVDLGAGDAVDGLLAGKREGVALPSTR